MRAPRTSPRGQTFGLRSLAIALVISVSAAGIAIGSFGVSSAFFSSQAVVSDNSLSSGTVELSATPASAVIGLNDMAPGDATSGSLVLTNSGSLSLRYALTSSATNADGKNLRDQLQLTIKTLGSGCNAFDGNELYSGSIGAAAFGNPAAGQQSGDRQLDPGNGETLCLRAKLPAETPNSFQSAATSVTFTFNAEQTVNNP
jgi:spore coat-associated protein N